MPSSAVCARSRGDTIKHKASVISTPTLRTRSNPHPLFDLRWTSRSFIIIRVFSGSLNRRGQSSEVAESVPVHNGKRNRSGQLRIFDSARSLLVREGVVVVRREGAEIHLKVEKQRPFVAAQPYSAAGVAATLRRVVGSRFSLEVPSADCLPPSHPRPMRARASHLPGRSPHGPRFRG